MPKKYMNENVLNKAKERISYVFDNFEKIILSYSGGKDSTVMLHLVMEEAIKRNRKIAIMFIDLEGQYKMTIEHNQRCFDLYKDNMDLYWICLPIHLRNRVSVYETHWLCWDKEKKDSWIRPLSKQAISDEKYFPFFKKGIEFEEFDVLFAEWYANKQKCAVFVGIRCDESLNRFRTIASKTKETFDKKQWTTKVTENTYNIYPLYDWKTQDIWVYQGKNPKKPHNHLYDLMHKAGLSISQQRICQPYGDDQRKGLWLFHLIEPETWARIVARVNGANSGALYINETGNINGYRAISKTSRTYLEKFCYFIIKFFTS
jgi:predicted phosphoadenosine phosphosulfate sulfurtransferase